MAKTEWGIKRVCQQCGTRYYDLKKKIPTCPKCKSEFDPEAMVRSRKSRAATVETLRKKETTSATSKVGKTATDEDITLEDVETTGEDEAVIEDISELGEEDVETVVELENEEE